MKIIFFISLAILSCINTQNGTLKDSFNKVVHLTNINYYQVGVFDYVNFLNSASFDSNSTSPNLLVGTNLKLPFQASFTVNGESNLTASGSFIFNVNNLN